MKARITKVGATRLNVSEGTVIAFDEVNQFGVTSEATIDRWWMVPGEQYERELGCVSVYPFCKEDDINEASAVLIEDDHVE